MERRIHFQPVGKVLTVQGITAAGVERAAGREAISQPQAAGCRQYNGTLASGPPHPTPTEVCRGLASLGTGAEGQEFWELEFLLWCTSNPALPFFRLLGKQGS